MTRDGRLTAMDIDALFDGGAYATLSAVVLSRGVIHASGPYRCDHVRIRGRAVMTNTPPNGAFRGFGAPQTQFAVEVHMDRIAEALGLDPVRVREINALRPGDTTATGQRLGRDCSALQVLREAVKRTGFKRRRRALAHTNRGIGLSLFFHGSGFTGGGEVKLASKASLGAHRRGARILVASTEIGQGTRTMHAQIVADTLGLPYDGIDVNAADTGEVPDSGPTVASRTCMVVGPHPAALRRGDARAARHAHAAPNISAGTARWSSPNNMSRRRARVGRRHVSRRCLRQLRLGLRRRRGRGRSRHVGGDADRVHDGSRDRQSHPSDAGAARSKAAPRRASATRCSKKS